MRLLQQFFLLSGVLSMLLLFTGLYKPWVVLWWRASQNRRKVFQLYGLLTLLSAGGYLVLTMLVK
ncbi:MAG TPA: hypothetical protein VKZ75_08940 [Cyclobacteriaceae bacterium]|nr:hypothetical protein [Cyclobacteriaceae bacterium]